MGWSKFLLRLIFIEKERIFMKYIDYIALSPKEQMKYKLKLFGHNLVNSFLGFFVSIGNFFVNLFKKVVSLSKSVGYAFVKGDIWTKLSFLFLGTSHIARGQILKGLMYLLIEGLFIFYIVMIGASALDGLSSLGVNETYYQCFNPETQVVPEEFLNTRFYTSSMATLYCTQKGFDTTQIRGDNSSLLLLFGILAVILVISFIFFYFSIVKSSIDVQEKKEAHVYLNTAFDDVKELFDGKFYKLLLFLPVAGICIFTILPIIDMILMAFTNYDREHQYPASLFTWVGMRNFIRLFSSGGEGNFGYTFFHILLWTLTWAFFATFINFFLGIIVAMLINKKGIKFKKVFRTLFVLSIAMPQFISLLSWNKFLAKGGFVEALLKMFGWMDSLSKLTILEYPTSARIIIILINIWIGVPYTILTTTGILMNIPADLYESAQIDGASPAKMYFKITLPYIFFVTGPYLIQTFVGNINNFNVIFFLTGGAPETQDYLMAGKTDLLVTWLYKLTVNEQAYNLGAVIGIMVFVVCSFFSLIAYKHSSSVKNEEDFA